MYFYTYIIYFYTYTTLEINFKIGTFIVNIYFFKAENRIIRMCT